MGVTLGTMIQTYDKKTSANVKEIASIAMDEAQTKIDQLNTLGGNARNQTSNYLLEWQKWIATISFSLVAIGGALFVQGDSSHFSVLVSFALFLAVGVWVLVEHKRQFEKAASISSVDIDNLRPLYDSKKKAAFDLWEDPSSLEKHNLFLKKAQAVMEYAKSLGSVQSKELDHDKINYLNDIWLGMFVSAVYLLTYPTFETILKQYNIQSAPLLISYWLVLFIFILFIVIDIQHGTPYITQANKSKRAKTQSEIEHTDGYNERLVSQIEQLENLLNKEEDKS